MENQETSNLMMRLTNLAFKKTIPFCYGCYIEAPTGRCAQCHSDDLMRLLPSEGCEYGTDWVIRSLLSEALASIDTEEAFEDSIRSCYPETVTVGWMELDTVTVMKDSDSVSWDMAQSEWLDSEVSEGIIVTFDSGSTYYWTHEVEAYLDKCKLEESAAYAALSLLYFNYTCAS